MFSGDLEALASQVAAATAAANAALKAKYGCSTHVNAESVTKEVESKANDDDRPARKRPKHEGPAAESSEGQPEDDVEDDDEDEGKTAYLRYMSSVLGPFPKQLSDARDFEVR